MKLNFIKRYAVKTLACVTAMSCLAPAAAVGVSAANEGTLISLYDFENGLKSSDGARELQVSGGGAVIETVTGIGGNAGTAVKINKTATGNRADRYVSIFESENQPVSVYNSDATAKFFKLDFKIYIEDEGFESIAPAPETVQSLATPLSVNNANSYSASSQKPIECLKQGEWNEVSYIYKFTNQRKVGANTLYDVVADITVNGETAAEEITCAEVKANKDNAEQITTTLLMYSDYTTSASSVFTVYLDDISLTTYEKNPTGKPELADGEGYTVSNGSVTVTGVAAIADLNTANVTSVKVYADSFMKTELSQYDTLSAGNIIVISNGKTELTYTVVSDPNTFAFKNYNDGVLNKYYNDSKEVGIEAVSGWGGKPDGDISLKVNAKAEGTGSNENGCWSSVTGAISKAPYYFKVDFSIWTDDDNFGAVSIAGGWSSRFTPSLYIGDNETGDHCLKKGEWNRVSFVFHVDEENTWGGANYYTAFTTDAYVNGRLVLEGQTVQGRPEDPTKDDNRFSIKMNLISADLASPYTVYIDDISCAMAKNESELAPKYASFGQENGMEVLQSDTQIRLVSPYALKSNTVSKDNILLNGSAVGADKLNLFAEGGTVIIDLKGLNNGEAFKLSLGSENWRDIFGRALPETDLVFKTIGKVSAEAFSFDKTAVEEGEITARASGLKNNTNQTQDATLIMLLIKDGRIAAREVNKVTLAAGETDAAAECTIAVPDVSDGEYRLSCFLWDSLASRVSYCGHIELTE